MLSDEQVEKLIDDGLRVGRKRIDRSKVDLGRGKKSLVRGGRYDAKYMITVPGDLDGSR